MSEAESLARACAEYAADRKAEDIAVLDLRGKSSFCDYFVVCSGMSDPQLRAIGASVRSGVRERFGFGPYAEDGAAGSRWIVIDYAQVVVHVFHHESREFYSLEDLWGDAPRLELEVESL
ncbi:MAG: ribosome silencing factor [Chthoniobacterales bacterium]